jgi:hypothetical protein
MVRSGPDLAKQCEVDQCEADRQVLAETINGDQHELDQWGQRDRPRGQACLSPAYRGSTPQLTTKPPDLDRQCTPSPGMASDSDSHSQTARPQCEQPTREPGSSSASMDDIDPATK